MFGGYFSYVKGLEILSFRRLFFLYNTIFISPYTQHLQMGRKNEEKKKKKIEERK